MPKRRSRRVTRPRRVSRLRRVEPGTTYLITKKTNDDRFLIRPSKAVNKILLYVLVLKGLRYGVLIHGFCFMSNHFHLVVTDVRGELPAFMRDFLTDSSKALQVETGESCRIWSGKRYSDVKLLDLDAAERKLVYSILNPPRAELTEPGDWPGLTSANWRFGETITAQRPDLYFSKRYRPKSVSIELAPLPQAFLDLSEEELVTVNQESQATIDALIESEVEEIRQDLERRDASMAGAERVLATPRETRGTHPVRTLLPRFATRNLALLSAAIAEARQFESDHEKARQRYVAGHSRAVFPPGTYGYQKLLGVRVAKRKEAA